MSTTRQSTELIFLEIWGVFEMRNIGQAEDEDAHAVDEAGPAPAGLRFSLTAFQSINPARLTTGLTGRLKAQPGEEWVELPRPCR